MTPTEKRIAAIHKELAGLKLRKDELEGKLAVLEERHRIERDGFNVGDRATYFTGSVKIGATVVRVCPDRDHVSAELDGEPVRRRLFWGYLDGSYREQPGGFCYLLPGDPLAHC